MIVTTNIVNLHLSYVIRQRLEYLTAKAEVATVLVSIPASSEHSGI
jgi:hypothetical protein